MTGCRVYNLTLLWHAHFDTRVFKNLKILFLLMEINFNETILTWVDLFCNLILFEDFSEVLAVF